MKVLDRFPLTYSLTVEPWAAASPIARGLELAEGKSEGKKAWFFRWEGADGHQRVIEVTGHPKILGRFRIEFEDPENRHYTFVLLTKALWDEKVKREVHDAPEFRSTDALQAFYREGGEFGQLLARMGKQR